MSDAAGGNMPMRRSGCQYRVGGSGNRHPHSGEETWKKLRENEKENEKEKEKEQPRASLRLSLRLHWKKSSSLRSRVRCGPSSSTFLLHEKLIAWQVAMELLRLVRSAHISDAKLRDQAMRAAQSACLNIAEANGRFAPADRRRVFAIARGEATEAAAALQVAAASGLCPVQTGDDARQLGGRLAALLTGLIR